jgi:uncharacterized protein (DUF2336 family)
LGGAGTVADNSGSLDTAVFDAVIELGTAEERRELALQLAALLGAPQVSCADRAAVVPALVALAADPVRDIRGELAAALTGLETLDAEIVFSIIAADDDIAVAFIASAKALDRARMLSILKVGDEARQCALAGRPDLPQDVAVALIEGACEAAVSALLDNGSVSLRPSDFKRIYLRFGNNPALVNRLLDIAALPAEIRLLEVRRAAQRLHQLVRERRWMMASEAEERINETEERMFLRILLAVEDQALEQVISFMSSRDMLTPSIMLRAACSGHMTVVEQALAWLAAMPGKHVSGQSLKAIHSAARIPEDCYPVMRAAFAVAGEAQGESEWPSEEQFGRRVVEAILTGQEGLAPLQSAKMLDLIGQFADDRTRALANRLKGSLTAVA